MADVAARAEPGRRSLDAGRSAVLRRFRSADAAFGALTLAAAVFVLVLLGGVIVSLWKTREDPQQAAPAGAQ